MCDYLKILILFFLLTILLLIPFFSPDCLEYVNVEKTRTIYKSVSTIGYAMSGGLVFGITEIPVEEKKYVEKECVKYGEWKWSNFEEKIKGDHDQS